MSAERGYELDAWREPSIEAGHTRIFSEHGRVLDNVCYRSHWLAVDKAGMGGRYYLVVKHGGGEERFDLGYNKRIAGALEALDSDKRYFMLYTLLDVKHDAERAAVDKTAGEYKRAFVEGRMRKRKMPRQDAVKVWVERAIVRAPA